MYSRIRSQWPFENLRPSNSSSETTAPMVLKFHMQHDEAAGLQNDDILPGRGSKMAAVAKIAIPIKSTFSPEPQGIFG